MNGESGADDHHSRYVRHAREQKEGGGAACDLVPRHPTAFESPRAERQTAGAARGEKRIGPELGHANLIADPPAHAPAEHHPKDRYVTKAGEHLQGDADNEPARLGLREAGAQPFKAREQRHERDNDQYEPGE